MGDYGSVAWQPAILLYKLFNRTVTKKKGCLIGKRNGVRKFSFPACIFIKYKYIQIHNESVLTKKNIMNL